MKNQFKAFILAAALIISSSLVPGMARAATPSATFYITPSSGTIFTGNTLAIDVLINTGGQAVCGVSGVIDFSSNLQYTSTNSTNSVFATEATPPVVTGNTVNFSRLCTGTGYTGTNGQVLHFVFTSIAVGTATLAFEQGNGQAIAYSDSTNVLQTVTGGSYTVNNPAINLKVTMPYRSNMSQSGIAVTVYSAGTSNQVAADSNLSSINDGTITDVNTLFNNLLTDSAIYDIKIVVPGYLNRKASNLTNVLSQVKVLANNLTLIPGNFSGSNTIALSDIVTGIRAFNGGTDNTAVLAKATFGGTFTLSNLVTMIRNFNTTPNGD